MSALAPAALGVVSASGSCADFVGGREDAHITWFEGVAGGADIHAAPHVFLADRQSGSPPLTHPQLFVLVRDRLHSSLGSGMLRHASLRLHQSGLLAVGLGHLEVLVERSRLSYTSRR